MKKKILAALVFIFITVANCTSSPMQGTIFTYTDHHIYDHGRGSQLNSGKIVKSGESCSFGIGIIPYVGGIFYGAAGGIEKAKDNGGLKKVTLIDKSSFSVIGPLYYPLFYKECTVVWGE